MHLNKQETSHHVEGKQRQARAGPTHSKNPCTRMQLSSNYEFAGAANENYRKNWLERAPDAASPPAASIRASERCRVALGGARAHVTGL